MHAKTPYPLLLFKKTQSIISFKKKNQHTKKNEILGFESTLNNKKKSRTSITNSKATQIKETKP